MSENFAKGMYCIPNLFLKYTFFSAAYNLVLLHELQQIIKKGMFQQLDIHPLMGIHFSRHIKGRFV